MAAIASFKYLEVWQMARKPCADFHLLAKNGELAKKIDQRGQMRRSSGSIMDNVAEGFERNGGKEFVQLLPIAIGAVGEFRSQLYRAFDCGYLLQKDGDDGSRSERNLC